jgi:hypothetical protein
MSRRSSNSTLRKINASSLTALSREPVRNVVLKISMVMFVRSAVLPTSRQISRIPIVLSRAIRRFSRRAPTSSSSSPSLVIICVTGSPTMSDSRKRCETRFLGGSTRVWKIGASPVTALILASRFLRLISIFMFGSTRPLVYLLPCKSARQ